MINYEKLATVLFRLFNVYGILIALNGFVYVVYPSSVTHQDTADSVHLWVLKLIASVAVHVVGFFISPWLGRLAAKAMD